MGKTTAKHIDDLRGLAEEFREDGNEPYTVAYLEAAADHLEDLADKLTATEDERDALAARLRAFEAPLTAIYHAANWLGFALDLSEPVPVLEVRR